MDRRQTIQDAVSGLAVNALHDGIGKTANGSWKVAGHIENILQAVEAEFGTTAAELDFAAERAEIELAALLGTTVADL